MGAAKGIEATVKAAALATIIPLRAFGIILLFNVVFSSYQMILAPASISERKNVVFLTTPLVISANFNYHLADGSKAWYCLV